MLHQNGRTHAAGQHQLSAPNAWPPPSPRGREPAQSHLELAGWILAWEVGDTRSDMTVPAAAERACQKLLDRLANLLTTDGCQAIGSRALHLARVDFAFLPEIEPGETAAGYAGRLGQRAKAIDPVQVHTGLAFLLARLIELVALFIGEYLTGRLLREVWPDLPHLDATIERRAD